MVWSLKAVLDPIGEIDNKPSQHPGTKSDPGASGHLHHKANIQKDAQEWEERQTRYLKMRQMGALWLSLDDPNDPSNDHQEQHNHCDPPWVSRKPTWPLGQHQAKNNQQQNKQ
ncbi:hypothetical protein VULLAG_LOCUS7541 [Vulpes lagopus]